LCCSEGGDRRSILFKIGSDSSLPLLSPSCLVPTTGADISSLNGPPAQPADSSILIILRFVRDRRSQSPPRFPDQSVDSLFLLCLFPGVFSPSLSPSVGETSRLLLQERFQ